MTQIGIGEFTSTKPAATAQRTAAPAPKQGLKLHARPHPTPADASDQEGQLSVDILHREDQMIIVCPIAGVEKGDIRVSMQDDVLTIRGERKNIEGLNMGQALVQEIFWGTFSRSIVLPDHIDRKNIEARVHEHMLLITIPKTEDFKSRIIHVENE